MYDYFHMALENIGISSDEIAERHLHLHAWLLDVAQATSFFNTELLKGGLTIPQTQAVTGHKTERMTEWYLHFDPTEFVKARMIQEGLLLADDEKAEPARLQKKTANGKAAKGKAETGKKPGRPDLKLVKPERETRETRKGA
jgi:creatinine amidohydrolase/Fe(II)-dependent formamide hydrolase-like protein